MGAAAATSPPAAARPTAARRMASLRGRPLLLAIGTALVLAFGAIAWVQQRQIALLSDNVRYEGDNLAWSFFQLEAEALQLRDQLREALQHPAGEADLSALRQRFELLASRVPLVSVERTRRFADMGPTHPQALAAVQAFIDRHDPLLAESSTQPATTEALAAANASLEPLIAPIHDLSLRSNDVIAMQVGRRNAAVREQTRLGIGLTLFQSLLTLAFAWASMRQFGALARRRAELETLAEHLHEARRGAEAASQAKSAFLANMSHELRTPFNGMLGMLALLESSRLDAEQADHVRTARESASHLLDLLNDILDISKLESGRLDIAPHPLALPRLVGEVQVLMTLAAEAKQLALVVDLSPDLPGWVLADGKRLKQILFNLMSNALKFTEAGRVRLQVTAKGAPDAQRGHALVFEVSDTGIGMDDRMLGRLFQRFSQGDASTSRRFGGTGLGLEISRSLARLMGGDITVRSTPGEGSVFTLRLTLPGCVPQPTSPMLPPGTGASEPGDSAGALDLLVAEDHPVNRKFMAILLGRMGHQVRMAHNGLEAVQAVQARVPDLVFMDLHMPEMDGEQATRQLRALPAPAGQVRIVALTADAFRETRERLLASGMDRFLAKPVQPDEIEALLTELFGSRARVVPRTPPANTPVHDTAHPPAKAAPHATADTASTAGAPPPAQAPTVPPPAAEPAEPAKPPPRRRFRAGDVATHLDMAVIGDVCVGVGWEGFRGLLEGFLGDESGTLEAMQAALRDGRAADVPPLAHAVKGAAASMGLRAIQDLARDWELNGAERDAAACRAAAATLAEQVDTATALSRHMGLR